MPILCANTLLVCVAAIHLSQAFSNVLFKLTKCRIAFSVQCSFIEGTCTVQETVIIMVTTISLTASPQWLPTKGCSHWL